MEQSEESEEATDSSVVSSTAMSEQDNRAMNTMYYGENRENGSHNLENPENNWRKTGE